MSEEQTTVTKKDLADSLNVEEIQITDDSFNEFKTDYEKEHGLEPSAPVVTPPEEPKPEVAVEVKPETPVETPPESKPEEWVLPEEHRDKYVDASVLKEFDAKAVMADEKHPLHNVVKRIIGGDPLRDESHPFHQQTLENRKATSKAMEELRQAQEQIAVMELRDEQTNAKAGIYGGMTLEDARDDGKEVEWNDARDDYRDRLRETKQRIATEVERGQNENKAVLSDLEKIKVKYPDADPVRIFNELSTVTVDGDPNPDAKLISPEEGYHVVYKLRKYDNPEAYEKAIHDEGKSEGKAEVTDLLKKAGIEFDAKGNLNLPDNVGLPVPPGAPMKPVNELTPAEIINMSVEERQARINRGDFGDLSNVSSTQYYT